MCGIPIPNINTRIIKNESGIATILFIVIGVAILIVGGTGYYLVTKQSASQRKLAEEERLLREAIVSVPDVGLPSVPELRISSLDIAVPDLPALNIFSGFSLDTDVSYKGNLNISAPKLPVKLPSQQQLKVDCSYFEITPSCSFLGSPDSQLYKLCKQCFPNK